VFIFIICNTSIVFSQIITHTSPSGGMYVYAEYPGDDEGYHIINVSGEEYIELSIYLEVW
jgi:hypothetical protein